MGRCVRQAYLCGENHLTGKNFDHRKQWIVDRLKPLSFIFAIDVCAYAVMSNHYHVVLKVNAEQAKAWTDLEVAQHWTMIFSGSPLVQRWMQGEPLDHAQQDAVSTVVSEWRKRLHDISWYMRCLNEYIARLANEEDQCKGRFWEGRFKSQALLDEAAVITCMMYVDLNPTRAGMTETLEGSDFTSIQERLLAKPKPARGRPSNKANNKTIEPNNDNTEKKEKPTKGDFKVLVGLAPILPF